MNMPVFCKHVQSAWNTYLQRSCVCCFCVQCLDIIRIISFCFIAQRVTRSARYHLWQVDISCSSPCLRFSYLLLVCAILVIHHCSSLGLKFFFVSSKDAVSFWQATHATYARAPPTQAHDSCSHVIHACFSHTQARHSIWHYTTTTTLARIARNHTIHDNHTSACRTPFPKLRISHLFGNLPKFCNPICEALHWEGVPN